MCTHALHATPTDVRATPVQKCGHTPARAVTLPLGWDVRQIVSSKKLPFFPIINIKIWLSLVCVFISVSVTGYLKHLWVDWVHFGASLRLLLEDSGVFLIRFYFLSATTPFKRLCSLLLVSLKMRMLQWLLKKWNLWCVLGWYIMLQLVTAVAFPSWVVLTHWNLLKGRGWGERKVKRMYLLSHESSCEPLANYRIFRLWWSLSVFYLVTWATRSYNLHTFRL